MAYAVNDNLGFCGAIEYQIRVRIDDHAAKAALARWTASLRILQEKSRHRLNSGFYVLRALWRTLVNEGKNFVEFGGGAERIAKPHSPCFAQMARI